MTQPVQPLNGIRVLDLTRLPPGGYCTVLLADLGADVYRVESPRGTPFPSAVGLSRAKRSIALDLRHAEANAILRRLAAWVDVLVENERPGAMDARGFGYSHAASEMPALVWCSISGYGQEGPYAQWSGHDLSFTAHSGVLAALHPDLPWHPQAVVAIPAAALMAVVGILSALRERDRTGRGCQLDISISESATWLLSGSDADVNGPTRGIPAGPDRHLYQCADGGWIVVAAAEPRTWTALCEALGVEDLIPTLHQWPDPGAVKERLATIFRTRPAAEWVAEIGPRGTAIVKANRGPELCEDPHVVARQSLLRVGEVLVPRSAVRFRGTDGEAPSAPSAPPADLGADTEAALLGAGYSVEEIVELREAGAVGG